MIRKIRDNQTGQILEVDESKLGEYGISLPTTQTTPEATLSGLPDIKQTTPQSSLDIDPKEHYAAYERARAAGDKAAAAELYKRYEDSTAYQKTKQSETPSLTESQQAREDTKKLANEALTTLTDKSKNIKTGLIAGPLEQKKAIFGVADQDTLDFQNTLAQIKATLAKARAGTSFTPNEEKMLSKYTPSEGDSRQQLQTKLNGLVSFFGGTPVNIEKEEKSGTLKNIGETALDIGKTIFSGPIKLGQAIGTAASLAVNKQEVDPEIDKLRQRALDLAKEAQKKGDTEGANKLFSVINSMNEAQTKSTNERLADIEQGKENAIKGAVGTAGLLLPGTAGTKLATKVATGAVMGGATGYSASKKGEELPNIAAGALIGGALPLAGEVVKKGVSKIISSKKINDAKKLLTTVGGESSKDVSKVITKDNKRFFNPKNIELLGQARKTLADANKKTINGNVMVEAARKYVENDPLAENYFNKIIPTIENKNLTVSQLMEKIDVWNKAYTSAGKVGKASKSGFYDVIARTAKEEIKREAPEVAAYTDLLRKAFKMNKIVSKVGKAIIPTAVGGALGVGIGKAL